MRYGCKHGEHEGKSETVESSLFSNQMISDVNIEKVLANLLYPKYEALRAFTAIQSSADTIIFLFMVFESVTVVVKAWVPRQTVNKLSLYYSLDLAFKCNVSSVIAMLRRIWTQLIIMCKVVTNITLTARAAVGLCFNCVRLFRA